MPRALSCSICRQDKARCDAFTLAPKPCTRCRIRDLDCIIEPTFKRTSTISRFKRSSQEVQDPKQSPNSTTKTNQAASASPSQGGARAPSDVAESFNPDNGSSKSTLSVSSTEQVLVRLGNIILVHSEINDLFRDYFQRYHPLFPVLDPAIAPSSIQIDCPPLFWAVITTAARSTRPDLYPALCDLVPSMISGTFFHQSHSAQPCQALLILCMFPLPTTKSREDVRWMYSGMAMQMATLVGLHKTASDHEYRKAGTVRVPEEDRQELTRTWCCCCYANATLSTELGLPSSIPQDALSMEDLSRAALPAEFVSATRISLESTKISKLVDLKMATDVGTSSDANTTHFGLLRMLDSDLDALTNSMRTKETRSAGIAELSLLMAKLNLCSFGLNQAIRLRTSDAAQLRLSTFNYATRLIQLFAEVPFVLAPTTSSVTTWSLPLPVQTFYPRHYWYGLVYACLVLMKLSLTSTLPEIEADQSKSAIQLAVDLLNSCSVEGDELYRVAKLIGLLRKEAVQELVQPRHKVQSRMGASLMYEMIFSVLFWKKRKEREQQQEPNDSIIWPNFDHNAGNAPQLDKGSITPDLSSRAMDELIASSGYLIEDWGPVMLDPNIWDTSAFDELCLPNTMIVESLQ
ncbi:hypothetical protein, variant 1 [Exophiala sideris]|uniref:Zn(2)-C6 fungal-type domain-containing protein n=1 Tax=Exophiala sideris TaxID=1016849 RepID=A0A0D1VTW4_9EURO|nr:hypothetical protein, variant 1 [Exophiala sideris]